MRSAAGLRHCTRPNAPDLIWNRLVDEADRLGPWIDALPPGPDRDRLAQRHREWIAKVWAMAPKLAADPALTAGITRVASLRLDSRPRHLRIVDADKRIICLCEYEYGLRLMRYPEEPGGEWQHLAAIAHGRDWLGLPRALAAGPSLERSLGLSGPGPHVLVATDRGELRLYRFGSDGAPAPIWRRDIDMDVRCCTIAQTPRPWLLLGGVGRDRHACIRRLAPQSRRDGFDAEDQALWRDAEPDGVLRMLVETVAPSGTAGAAPSSLWATDRKRGRLYRWRLPTGNQMGRLVLLEVGPMRQRPDNSLPLPRRQQGICYPLRCPKPLPGGELPGLIHERQCTELLSLDPICAQAFMHKLWLCVRQTGPDAELGRALAPLLQQIPNIVLVPFVRIDRVQDLLQTPNAAVFRRLLAELWAGIAQRNRDDNLCHQARTLAHALCQNFLDARGRELDSQAPTTSSAAGPRDQQARAAWDYLRPAAEDDAPSERRLFEDVQRCLWQDRTACPAGFWEPTRILGLRLGQAARVWHWARERTKAQHLPAAINLWLDLLWRLWGCPHEDGFRAHLAELLEPGVPLLPAPWGRWLQGLLLDRRQGPEPMPDWDLFQQPEPDSEFDQRVVW